ncbi:hypothetical protein AB0I84_09030 [Streptomyces spectabilis]|uniref:hypothetical protein n=1 Tax=Streptomyces spectabilis TaxID=68270 RepID=UPI0033E43A54
MSENDTSVEGAESAPFADIVREALAVKGETLRRLAERSVDPQTGKAVGHSTLWKIADGQSYKRERWLVRAVAAGVGRDLAAVQAAAAEEWTGLVVGDPLRASTTGTTVVVAYASGTTPEELPILKEKLKELGLDGAQVVSSTDSNPRS